MLILWYIDLVPIFEWERYIWAYNSVIVIIVGVVVAVTKDFV